MMVVKQHGSGNRGSKHGVKWTLTIMKMGVEARNWGNAFACFSSDEGSERCCTGRDSDEMATDNERHARCFGVCS